MKKLYARRFVSFILASAFMLSGCSSGGSESGTTSWELLWSGEVTCRYIMLKIYTPDNGPGTVRLYELQAG